MSVTKITIPKVGVLSIENDTAGVPDTTIDSGANVMEVIEDNQKDLDDDEAEFNSDVDSSETEKDDVVEAVEKANESSFMGLLIAQRAREGFGLKKAKSYVSVDAFFKSAEAKAAIETAKAWAEKKGYTLAKNVEGCKNYLGVQFKVKEKAKVAAIMIVFVNKKGKLVFKKFAAIRLGAAKGTESSALASVLGFSRESTEEDVDGDQSDVSVDSQDVDTSESDVDTEEETESDVETEEETEEDFEKSIEAFFKEYNL